PPRRTYRWIPAAPPSILATSATRRAERSIIIRPAAACTPQTRPPAPGVVDRAPLPAEVRPGTALVAAVMPPFTVDCYRRAALKLQTVTWNQALARFTHRGLMAALLYGALAAATLLAMPAAPAAADDALAEIDLKYYLREDH